MLADTKARCGSLRAAPASLATDSSCWAYVRRLLSMRCDRAATPRGPLPSLWTTIAPMREVTTRARTEAGTFAACLATILELPPAEMPELPPGEDVAGWRISRWLGGLGLGLVPVADAGGFSWPGPWIGLWQREGTDQRRVVVMYGVPSGIVHDPLDVPGDAIDTAGWTLAGGFVVAAADIALARPQRPAAPASAGRVEAIFVASSAGSPARSLDSVRALRGRGLDGDRHLSGRGTFPSGLPGSALTLIEQEVCASFSPPLAAAEHRRNVVTSGIDLNALVGHEFAIAGVRCRGKRLCEPCTVVDGYADRPLLRALVHRGGLRADVLEDGVINVGDALEVSPVEPPG